MDNWINDPYPHCFGTGFFSDDQYKAMLRNLPQENEMEEADPSYKHPDISVRRDSCLRYCVYEDTPNPFWHEVFKFIKDQYPKERTSILLYKSLPGFNLLPHTDFVTKNETTVYYLTDKEIPDIGTVIYKCRIPNFKCPDGKTHYGSRAFNIEKIAPFVPNGYMKFKRSAVSFHGVESCPVVRWAIYFTRYLPC